MEKEMEIRIERYKKYRTLAPMTADEIKTYTVPKMDARIQEGATQKKTELKNMH